MADPSGGPPPVEDIEWLRQTLVRAVGRICPKHLAHLREDIVSCAMLRILEILRKGEQGGIRTTSYIWKVAYTVTVDEIRRLQRSREVPLTEAVPEQAQEAPPTDLGIEIRDCLARLAEPRRQAVVLHLYGFRAEEATKVLGFPLKRVQNLLYRGLADLRRCLESKGIAP